MADRRRISARLAITALLTLLTIAPLPAQIAPTPMPVLRFSVNRGRMTVPVHVDGRGPYQFVVDTGAERSVISRELAGQLALRAGRPARLYSFAGVAPVSTVQVPSLVVSKASATAIEAPSLRSDHLGAVGMLGIDALQGHRVTVDFGRQRMILTPTRRRAIGDVVIKAGRRDGQLIVSEARIGGHPIDVVIDTGSPITVANEALRRILTKPPRRLGLVSVISVTGQSFDADYVAVDALHLGGIRFDNVPLAFSDAPPFARFGLADRPALILGISTLRLFRRVDLDFANGEIVFSFPRSPLHDDVCGRWMPCSKFGRI